MKHLHRRILVGLLSCMALWAQAVSTSQISGTVQDSTGSAIEGAAVKVTQTDTGFAREVSTAVDGSYTLPNLPVGPYELRVALPGFREYVQRGIVLAVGEAPAINVVLEVGGRKVWRIRHGGGASSI